MPKNITSPRVSTGETVSEALQKILFKTSAKKQDDGWQGCCPAHEDKTPSLSIKMGDDGRILLFCHAGCSIESVVSHLGLKMSDLFREKKIEPIYEFERAYDYRDESGHLRFQVVRERLVNAHECPNAKPKRFKQRRPDERGEWIWKIEGVRRVLYRLPELIASHPEATVFICEGEKDADRLRETGLIATTSPSGAGKWREEYNQDLRGREIVILADNDDSGRKHAEKVARSLAEEASSIRVLHLPNLPIGGDVSDWLDAGGDAETLCRMADGLAEWTDTESKAQATAERPSKGRKFDVIELACERASFFHDDDNKHYASVKVSAHIETYPIESRMFKIWLAGIYFEATGTPLYGESLKEAIATIQALAQYQGEERNVSIRLAEHNGNLYLDLCDRDWRIVEITTDDWRVISSTDAPMRFVRRAAMQALPEPVKGGKVAELRNFLNVEDDSTWSLIASWLVMAFHPAGPYPILSVCGEQGSAKTTACKILRSLVDPNRADLRAVPKDERDLMIGAANSWILAYDNLSGISQELSDTLCRVATGAGFSTRTLHTDSEETIFSVKRPIITNGIIDTAVFSDLADRAISVFLRAIPDEKRREEHELWPAFHLARPRILGSILSAVSHALKNRDAVKLDRRPRMADFARWAVAAEPALEIEAGTFFSAYDDNRSAANELALDSALAIEIQAFVDNQTGKKWEGTATQLLNALNVSLMTKGENSKEKHGWPKAAHSLTGILRRLATNFRAVGIEVETRRNNKGSQITIKRLWENSEKKRH